MTNKEAINIIKCHLIDEKLFIPRVLGIEALELAIKALEETERNPTITSWYDFDEGYRTGYKKAKEELKSPADGMRDLDGFYDICRPLYERKNSKMKIVLNERKPGTEFNKLAQGDCFKFDDKVYIKILGPIDNLQLEKENVNCFCVSSNRLGYFSSDTQVQLLNMELREV